MQAAVCQAILSNLVTEELNLENMNISSIEPYIMLFSQMPRLRSVSLRGNALTDFLIDLKEAFPEVHTLNISQNPISSAESVLPGLLSMPNLKHLKIEFKNSTDEDTIVVSLPALETFNGIALNGELDGKDEVRDTRYRDPTPLLASVETDAWIGSTDRLYEAVSSSLPLPVHPSEDYPSFKARVVEYANSLTAGEKEKDLVLGEVLKARRVLADYCMEQIFSSVELAGQSGGGLGAPKTLSDANAVLQVLTRGLRELQLHYGSLLDDYDQHWRFMTQQHSYRVAQMKKEMQSALQQVEALIAASAKSPNQSYLAASKRAVLAESAIEKSPVGPSSAKGAVRPPQTVLVESSRTNTSRIRAGSARNSSERGANDANPSMHRRVNSQSTSNKKVLTLRQLLDMIDHIYTSKEKYDERCQAYGLPFETMEQHMYTFLNQRYGLREIIVDYASAIIDGVKRFSTEQNEVAVFAKILRNDIDEGFRYVQRQICVTVPELLRCHLREKYPARSDQEIQQLMQEKTDYTGLNESEWTFIVEYMYEPEDASFLKELIAQDVPDRQLVQTPSPRASATGAQARVQRRQSKAYPYSEFIRLLLDFQLDGHERFLASYVSVFRRFDRDKDGVVNQDEFGFIIQHFINVSNDEERKRMIESAFRNLASQLSSKHDFLTFSQTISLLGENILLLVSREHGK